MRAGRWLLDVDLGGGKVLRLADSPTEVDGIPYLEGLEPPSLGAQSSSTGITITAAPLEGWAMYEARYGPLEAVPAVLRWHRDGQTLEEARTMLRGELVEVEVGVVGEPMTATLLRSSVRTARPMPGPGAVVSESTLGLQVSEPSRGVPYPELYGYPGSSETGSTTPCFRVGLYNDLSFGGFLVANGHIAGGFVDLFRLKPGVFSAWRGAPLIKTYDDEGRPITVVNTSSGQPAGFRVTDGEYYGALDVRFSGVGSFGVDQGGMPRVDGTPLRGAAEVMRDALKRYSTIPIDEGRWSSVADLLDQYQIDAYIDEPIDAWEWIERAVIPILPVTVRESSRGLWLQPRRYRAHEGQVVRTLSVARGDIRRTSRRSWRDPVLNRFCIEYGHQATGAWHHRRTLTAQPGILTPTPGGFDSRVFGRLDLELSQRRFTERPAQTIQSAVLWDGATADRVLQDQADRYGWPKRAYQYVGGLDLDALDPGQYVWIVDEEVGVEGLALLEEVTPSVDEVVLDVTMLDGPSTVLVDEPAAAPVGPAFSLATFPTAPVAGGALRGQYAYAGTEPVTVAHQWYQGDLATPLVGETSDTLDPIPGAAVGGPLLLVVSLTSPHGFTSTTITSAAVSAP